MSAKHPTNKQPFFNGATVLFIILSVILLSVGIWFTLTQQRATGLSQRNRYGQGGGQIMVLTGPFIIILGLMFAVFPLADLFRYLRQKR